MLGQLFEHYSDRTDIGMTEKDANAMNLAKTPNNDSSEDRKKQRDNVFRRLMRVARAALGDKVRESIASVMPITLIVVVLVFLVIPVPTDLMLSFLVGAIMLIAGLSLFGYGSENSMSLIGAAIGSKLTKTRNIKLILTFSFLLGVIVTVAEPDLQVLAKNVPHINTLVLIVTVAIGVGMFLLISMVRILTGISLRTILLVFYGLIFLLAAFTDPNYLSLAFDSGGVTTGPMTAPFILAFGVGIASIRNDKNAEEDSFGLVALCSIGPILAVLLLSFFYQSESGTIAAMSIESYEDTVGIGRSYLGAIPDYVKEVAVALSPIIIMFLVFQWTMLKLPRQQMAKITLGILFTYIGLVIFLTGVNVGFSSLGLILGQQMASTTFGKYMIIPVSMLMGWFIVSAEPAVHVLTIQVEQVSAGTISGKSLGTTLSLAIAGAMGLSMLRILIGFSIMWFVVPGYAISLLLSFFVPKIFTAIAFDSGGVASGPMSATFMLPFAMGVCHAVGGNLLTEAFGIVALVAMMPLITIQTMGVIYRINEWKRKKVSAEQFNDTEVIELWEIG